MNPAITKAEERVIPVHAESEQPKNEDGFVPGQEVNYDELIQHKLKGNSIS